MNLDLKAAYERSAELAASHTPVTIDMLVELASLVMKNMSYNKVPGKLSELCDRINAGQAKQQRHESARTVRNDFRRAL